MHSKLYNQLRKEQSKQDRKLSKLKQVRMNVMGTICCNNDTTDKNLLNIELLFSYLIVIFQTILIRLISSHLYFYLKNKNEKNERKKKYQTFDSDMGDNDENFLKLGKK